MNVSAVVLRQDFEAALDAARAATTAPDLPGLSAPLGSTLLGAVSRVWDRVEHALDVAYTFGRERAQELVEQAVASVQTLLDQAGERIGDAQQALLLRIQGYVRTFVDRALAHVRPTLVVGGQELVLDGVDLAQTLSMSGSLKANIVEVVALTSGGELSLTARYVRAGS